jgi:TonB family protein
MLILIFSLIVFESVDVTQTRDSTIQQIKQGRWETAIANAKFSLIHESEDDLLLGIIKFAEVKGFISDLNPKFQYLLNIKKSNIIKIWEKFNKENKDNENILQVLAILYLDTDLEKTKLYTKRILELDSLNSFAYFIVGCTHEDSEDYEKAIQCYQKAFRFDTTFTDCFIVIANSYMMTDNYDSALVYFRQIPQDNSNFNSAYLGEIICALKRGNIADVESVLSVMDNQEIEHGIKSINEIQKYLNGLKESNLTPQDSFIVFIPVKLNRINWRSSKTLVAILTAGDIDIIKTKVYEKKPKPLSIPAPKYPESARRAGIEGDVIIKVLVNIDGSILDARIFISSGFQELDSAALEASMKAKFEPAKQFGRPVKVWVSIPVKFKLTGK